MGDRRSSSAAAPSSDDDDKSKTAELDPVLHSIGFEIQELSPAQLTGRLPVTARCCQPFKVLHGGVSALVAEALASMGAHMASGYTRVAGVHLSINHFRSAALGDVVLARAAPLHLGRSTQVWEVKLWKQDPSREGAKGAQISESRVTLLCNLPVPDSLKHAGDALKKRLAAWPVGGGGGGRSACAACKYQRRRCTPECPLAQYFPIDNPHLFRNAHRLFGVSNILKTLARAGPERHRDVMRAIIFESNAWETYPAHGCLAIVLALREQLAQTRLQLEHCNARIQAYRAALGPLPLDAAAAVDPSTAYGISNDAAAAAASSSTSSLQAPPWTMQPQHDITASNAIVANMAPVVPQLQHHQQDHLLLDGTMTMIPVPHSQPQHQQHSSNHVPPEPYDEMSSYLVDNVSDDEMPPHESCSTDSPGRKAVKSAKLKMELALVPMPQGRCHWHTSIAS